MADFSVESVDIYRKRSGNSLEYDNTHSLVYKCYEYFIAHTLSGFVPEIGWNGSG